MLEETRDLVLSSGPSLRLRYILVDGPIGITNIVNELEIATLEEPRFPTTEDVYDGLSIRRPRSFLAEVFNYLVNLASDVDDIAFLRPFLEQISRRGCFDNTTSKAYDMLGWISGKKLFQNLRFRHTERWPTMLAYEFTDTDLKFLLEVVVGINERPIECRGSEFADE
jgi:hypothetical protein